MADLDWTLLEGDDMVFGSWEPFEGATGPTHSALELARDAIKALLVNGKPLREHLEEAAEAWESVHAEYCSMECDCSHRQAVLRALIVPND